LQQARIGLNDLVGRVVAAGGEDREQHHRQKTAAPLPFHGEDGTNCNSLPREKGRRFPGGLFCLAE
jgi:hypothetical protein